MERQLIAVFDTARASAGDPIGVRASILARAIAIPFELTLMAVGGEQERS
jgi:hypothetical protein